MAQTKQEMSAGCFTSFMILFFVMSCALLFWAYSEYNFTRLVIEQNILVKGTVVDINKNKLASGDHRDLGSNKTAPVVEFVYKNDTIWFDSEQYSDIVDYKIGEEIEIYVNSQKPTESIINTWSEKWGFTFLLSVLGGVFFIISAGSLINIWRK